MQTKVKSALLALTVSGLSLTTQAAFVLLDNFESYNLNSGVTNTNSGDLGATWNNAGLPAGNMVVVNDSGNQVLSFNNSDGTIGGGAYRLLPTEIGTTSTAATYFWRMRVVNSSPLQAWTGLTDTTTSLNDFANWEAYTGINNSQTPNLNVRNGGSNVNPAGSNLALNTWGYYWMVVNNDDDNFELFFNLTGDTAVVGDSLGTFNFRNGTNGPLTTFGFLQGSATGGEIQFDDIYIDTTGMNLINPIPEPSTLVLLGLAGLSAFSVFRRKRT